MVISQIIHFSFQRKIHFQQGTKNDKTHLIKNQQLNQNT